MCRSHGWDKERVCLYEQEWDTQFEIQCPIIDAKGVEAQRRLSRGAETRVVNADDFLVLLEELKEKLGSDTPLYELMLQFFQDVCPTNFFDPFLERLLQWESAAREYHTLPYAGGYLDQPLYIIQAFQIIRGARGQYYALKDKRAEAKRKTATPPNTSSA